MAQAAGRIREPATDGEAVDSHIFKAYDVRGIYPQRDRRRTSPTGSARAFARVLADLRGGGAPRAACGWRSGTTCGHHSPALADAFARGLVDEGCHVLDIGMVGTEMVYYAVGSRELDGGVSVTASHNPKQWAGFKLVREGALPLSGDRGIQDVRRVVEAEDFARPAGQGHVRARGPLRGVPALRARLHRSRRRSGP